MSHVLTIGEAMALFMAESPGDLATVDRFVKRLAGAETNVAVGLSRLGFRVRWVSRLGDDSFGRFVMDSLAREGLDLTGVRIDTTRPTGFMLKSFAPEGEDPQIEYHRRGSAASALSLEDLDPASVLGASHLHATGVCPAISLTALELTEQAMQTLRAAGRTVSFDPNLRPRLWPGEAVMVETINRLASHASWVLPGLQEGRRLTGLDSPERIAAFYLGQGAEAVVVKLGAEGAYWRTAQAEGWCAAAPVAQVVDTVGAGDGFAVGVISARLEGLDWPAAVARGNWIGARAIEVQGDLDGLPFRRDLPSGV